MIVIEIPPNQNCDAVDMRVFHDLELPRKVIQVRLEREQGVPRWYEVIGWTVNGATVPALAQKVDDSGEGVAILIHGGDAGLRFRPAGSAISWQPGHSEQWGAPFILTADLEDVQFVESTKKT